ncbi:CHAT domain-containing protein [Lactarius vividus]|nr:CHAT domain-containing protein [Lactarius vividus]
MTDEPGLVDPIITHSQQFPSILSRSDPLRPAILFDLAAKQLERYVLSSQKEDLDNSILHLTESTLLQPRSWLQRGPYILAALFLLASALLKRSKLSNQPEDATYAAKYLRYLRDRPHEACPRHAVTTLLVDALAFQVELETCDVMQKIDEMAALCHELLTLDLSDIGTTSSITLLSGAVLSKISISTPNQPLDQVIECLRAARKQKLDLLDVNLALAHSLCCRYYMTFQDDDYKEAASILDEIVNSGSPGDSQDGFVANVQGLATVLATIRSRVHGTPEYSEEALYRGRALLSSSVKGRFNPTDLERTEKQRFRYFGPIEDPKESSGSSPLSQPVPVSFGEYEGLEFGWVRGGMYFLKGLLSEVLDDDSDITKLDEALEEGRTILASSSPRNQLTSVFVELFGMILFEAFERTAKIQYLNESISTRRLVLERPSVHFLRFITLNRLSRSLLKRFRVTSSPNHRKQDLDEALELLSQCANDPHASLPDRFRVACECASLARGTQHRTISAAYEAAMSLVQYALMFAPTLQQQHATLAGSNNTHSMSLDYASYWVDLNKLEEAIETLERGRALLWSEMRHLRTSVDQLLQEDQQLGHKFAVVNRDLEELTKSIPPSHKLNLDDDAADDLRAVDSFGQFLLKQRGLLKEREDLITEIKALPGFDSFLTSPSFDTLRSAASCGPVIIINHSIWRSDILILLHNTSPSLIPTSRNFYDRACALKERLLDSRRKNVLDSSHYDETLTSVLAELYDLVGKPVIDRLRRLQVLEQSRIWWCPTSVFCFLPLHAMGPIPSDDDEVRYFLDLYICSYTPTLSALIQSRIRDPGGEGQVVQALDTEVESLISEAATPAAVIDGFRHHRFVHLACHGTLKAGKPFEAGFELYGGKRLTLLEIVRSDLSTAEFAFLSACHTAEGTEMSIIDEILHLAAAVQYCGFRSVVGTMWGMVDDDGQELTKYYYKALFSNSKREQGVPYYERSAKALWVAVRKLRKKFRGKKLTLERWVNFVHYGA